MAGELHVWDLTNDEIKRKMGELIIRLVINGEPIPDTPEGRIALLESIGVTFHDRDVLCDVQFHQSTPSHMHIALPPKEMLQRGLDAASDPQAALYYALPDAYAQFAKGDVDAWAPLDMFKFRLGDYTMSHCR